MFAEGLCCINREKSFIQGYGRGMSSSPKARYQVTNWPAYNRSLCHRASLTIWFDPQMAWYASKNGQKGRNPIFSEAAIQCCLTLSNLFQLPLRQTTGLVRSLLQLIQLDYDVPNFSTLSRRQKTLTLPPLRQRRQNRNPICLLVDSTGIKETGAGQWLTNQHRTTSRRSWIKVHLAVNADTMMIEAIRTTAGNQMDAAQLPSLLDQIDAPVNALYADGAYDTLQTYRYLHRRRIKPIIRPPHNGISHEEPALRHQNRSIEQIRHSSLKPWQISCGYHLRSRVQSKMHALKRLGERVSARTLERQQVQMALRARILNRFMLLGRCRRYVCPEFRTQRATCALASSYATKPLRG